MKSDKKQTLALIGIALIVLAGVLLYIALSQPKIYVEDNEQTVVESQTSQSDYYSTSSYSSSSSYASSSSSGGNYTSTASDSYTESYESTNVSYPLNLNTATAEELATISGIGDVRAAAIIEYREEIGGYTSVEQIMDIKGIGEGIYAKVSPYLTV